MPKRKPRAALAAIALLLAPLQAGAQDFVPRTEYEEMMGEPKPLPAIPAQFAGIVRASSPELLLVKALDSREIPVNIDWLEPDEFHSFAQDRFIGFSFSGYETYGYILIDRAMAGEAAVIATGEMPSFSPDGRHFAAAELSESGYGNLNGVGVWEVLPHATALRFFSDALPPRWEWRTDGWARADCVAVSAISPEWQPEDFEHWEAEMAAAPRLHYSLEVAGAATALRSTYGQRSCMDGTAGE